MKHPQNEIVFQIGSKVNVKSDYQETGYTPHRALVGTVLKHETNKSHDGDFIDNYLQFETGEVEPFANWEIELVEESN